METEYFYFQQLQPGTEEYERYLEFRYAVFCDELRRITDIKAERSSAGLPIETDIFDPYSRHFMAYSKKTNEKAACVRMILPNPLGLNVHLRYQIDKPLPYPDANHENIGEISRMAIAPRYRRRDEDRGKPYQGDPELEMRFEKVGRRHHQPELVLGIHREIYQLCKSDSISYCVAAMEVRFGRLLTMLGYPFIPVGPINDSVQPKRRVFLISTIEMEKSLYGRDSRLLDFMRSGLSKGEGEGRGEEAV